MPTEKDIEFVQFLLDSTQKEKIQWQPSAKEGQFTTTLQQRYAVFMTKTTTDLITLELTDDPSGQELLSVRNLSIPQVEDLYEFVRRQALKVDSVLDQIMQGGLVITTARYGLGDHYVDVSQQLNDAITDDKLRVFVGNQLAGDPCPNVAKNLILEYRFRDQTFQRTVNEGETLDLP